MTLRPVAGARTNEDSRSESNTLAVREVHSSCYVESVNELAGGWLVDVHRNADCNRPIREESKHFLIGATSVAARLPIRSTTLKFLLPDQTLSRASSGMQTGPTGSRVMSNADTLIRLRR